MLTRSVRRLPQACAWPQRRTAFWSRSGDALEGMADTPLLSTMQANPKVYLTVEKGRETPLGRIEIELDSTRLPKAAENFVALCTGHYATFGGPEGGSPRDRSLRVGNLHYKHTNFHRVVPGFLIQGGDNEHYDGTGGWCALQGLKYFEDESYDIPFDKAGVVGMAVEGPNRNASQFFITTAAAPHLQRRCVAIGHVTKGYEVVQAIEEVETDHNDRPTSHIKIVDCGLV